MFANGQNDKLYLLLSYLVVAVVDKGMSLVLPNAVAAAEDERGHSFNEQFRSAASSARTLHTLDHRSANFLIRSADSDPLTQ